MVRHRKAMLVSCIMGWLGMASVAMGSETLRLMDVGRSAPSHAATLAWTYTQNPRRPATSFVVQRGMKTGSTCTYTDYITELPVTSLQWVDTSIVAGVTYCYTILAADPYGRSTPSSPIYFVIYDIGIDHSMTIIMR